MSLVETTDVGFDTGKAVRVYVELRDQIKVLTETYKKEAAALKAKQDLIGSALLQFLNKTKGNSFGTDNGLCYRHENVRANGDDWEKFFDWVKEEDAFEALERRIKTSFIKEYMEKNEGRLPPGVSVYREYEVRVRRS